MFSVALAVKDGANSVAEDGIESTTVTAVIGDSVTISCRPNGTATALTWSRIGGNDTLLYEYEVRMSQTIFDQASSGQC